MDEGGVIVHCHEFGLVLVSNANHSGRMNSCLDFRLVLPWEFHLRVRKLFESRYNVGGWRLKTVISELQVKLSDLEGVFLGDRPGTHFTQKIIYERGVFFVEEL